MENFRLLNKNEQCKYKKILDRAEAVLGVERNEALIVNIDGKEKILFVISSIFILFGFENSEIDMSSFVVDEEYNVMAMTKGNKQINIENNLLHVIDEEGNHFALSMLINENLPDFSLECNSIIEYMQYNAKNDVRIILRYENFGSMCNTICPSLIDKPFFISIEKKPFKRDKGLKFVGEKKAYYRLDFKKEENKIKYLLAHAIDDNKESHETLSIIKDDAFFRYYRILIQLGEYLTITGFPFSKSYRMDDVNEVLCKVGFNLEVQQELINLYNDKNDLANEFQKIAKEFKNSKYAKNNIVLLKNRI